jgi:hypothetical protein
MRIFTNEIMKNYIGGIIKDIECDEKNAHAILAVGWGIDEIAGEYVIL